MSIQSQKPLNGESRRKSRDANVVVIQGEVDDEPIFSRTGSGSKCARFTLKNYGKGRHPNILRVNAYEGTAIALEGFNPRAGDRFVVQGEIMTRFSDDGISIIELKAHSVSPCTG